MLHKSSENVDVTYKVDVKFNVIGPRMNLASRRPNYVTDSIRISVAWCNFDQFVVYNAKEEFLRWILLVFTKARESPTRVTLHPRDEKSPGLSTSVAKCAEERAIYVRSRSTAWPEKSAQGSFWITVLQRCPLFILRSTGYYKRRKKCTHEKLNRRV